VTRVTDAMVEAALDAWRAGDWSTWDIDGRIDMRAALEAALAVAEGDKVDGKPQG
jgi:hypothetical protein